MVKLPDGSRVRVSGTPSRNTKEAVELAEREHIDRVLDEARNPKRKEVAPTFDEWFNGRFWDEWVVSRKNKPSEQEAKKSIYKVHLKETFGDLRLDQIGTPQVAAFRASLVKLRWKDGEDVERQLSDKRINNVLAVLSKALKYAGDVELIARVPKVGMFKVERPEIQPWSFEEYARLLVAAREEGTKWYAAVCLAGEAGLRVGEVKALRWREDVDMVARTLTVNRQMRRGIPGTPKGRTRRVIPMSDRLYEALSAISTVREGLIFCKTDGKPLSDGQGQRGLDRICRLAGLPERQWHLLRHTFATHAAMFGVNPWSLQSWMGHKRIEETMLYVSYANAHRCPVPEQVLDAGSGEIDPDRRVLKMLAARSPSVAERRGKTVATREGVNEKRPELRLVN